MKSHYDAQIIINFDDDPRTAKAYQEKWNAQCDPNKCVILPLFDFMRGQFSLTKIFSEEKNIRFIVHAHGHPGNHPEKGNILRGKNYHHVDAHFIQLEKFAHALAEFIGKDYLGNILISLIACGGGSGDIKNYKNMPENSIAAKLLLHLKDAIAPGVKLPTVAGRNQIVWIAINSKKNYKFGKKQTSDLNEAWDITVNTLDTFKSKNSIISKQPGSKVIYSISESGDLVIQDAYIQFCRKLVLETLKLTANEEINPKIRKILNDFINDLETHSYTIKEIYNNLKTLENNPIIAKDCSHLFFKYKANNKIAKLNERVSYFVNNPKTLAEEQIILKANQSRL